MTEEEKTISGYESWKDRFPDFALVVAGKELACHKSFLSKNSPVLDRMLNINCKESNTNKMEVMNFDVETVTNFLEYLYAETIGADNLRLLQASSKGNGHIYKRNINKKVLTPQLLEMSHMYEVKDLEIDCIEHLKDTIWLKNVTDIWLVADKCQSATLKNAALKFVAKNPLVRQAPGFKDLMSPQVMDLIQYFHGQLAIATNTQEVLWIENDQKRSQMIEITLGFTHFKKSPKTVDVAGCKIAILANNLESIPEAKHDTYNHDEWTCKEYVFRTTFTAIRGIVTSQADCVIIFDMPSSIEEYVEVTQKLAKPGSYIVTFFNEDNRAVAKDLAKHLRQCNQQVPQWLKNMED